MGLHATHLTVPNHSINMVGLQLLGLGRVTQTPCLPRFSSSYSAPPNDTDVSKCEAAIKHADSDVAIAYQVNGFTCTRLAQCFIAQSHIYPGFMGEVSTLTHFPLEPGCEDYSFGSDN